MYKIFVHKETNEVLGVRSDAIELKTKEPFDVAHQETFDFSHNTGTFDGSDWTFSTVSG